MMGGALSRATVCVIRKPLLIWSLRETIIDLRRQRSPWSLWRVPLPNAFERNAKTQENISWHAATNVAAVALERDPPESNTECRTMTRSSLTSLVPCLMSRKLRAWYKRQQLWKRELYQWPRWSTRCEIRVLQWLVLKNQRPLRRWRLEYKPSHKSFAHIFSNKAFSQQFYLIYIIYRY